MGYLRRVHSVTLRDKEHRSEISEARNVKPLLRIPTVLVRPFIQNVPGKNGELSPSGYSLHPLESGPGDYISDRVTISPTLLGLALVWKQQNHLKFHAVNREVFRVLLGLLTRDFPQRKTGHQKEWMNEYVGLHWNFLFMKLSLVCLPKVNVVFK